MQGLKENDILIHSFCCLSRMKSPPHFLNTGESYLSISRFIMDKPKAKNSVLFSRKFCPADLLHHLSKLLPYRFNPSS